MLLPVELMSIVGVTSPSSNATGSEGATTGASASWLLTADASASGKSDKDMINRIFLSYEQSAELDPAAQFAEDLKALLNANGVSFSSDPTLRPPMLEFSIQQADGQTTELPWSVDELLQWAVSPSGSGNNLPLDDQSLPAELSQWLAALTSPGQQGTLAASDTLSANTGLTPTITPGNSEPGQATLTGQAAPQTMAVQPLTQLQPPGSSASALVLPVADKPTAPQTSGVSATDSLAQMSVTQPSANTVDLQSGAEAASALPVDKASGESTVTPVGQVAQELTGSAQAQTELTRQATQAVQLSPDSQKMAADAARASTVRLTAPDSSGTSEGAQLVDDISLNQPGVLKTASSVERNSAGLGQLAAALASSSPTDSATAGAQTQTQSQTWAQADGNVFASRADQRMFATENAQQSQSPAAQQAVARTAEGLPRFVMDTALGQQGWPDSLGRQLLVMSGQGVSSAQIQLDPPELGSLMVKIQVSADQQTSVSFVSQHALVRETLEQQLGRLQDLFRDQGLNLQDVSVSDQSPQQREGESGQQQGRQQGNAQGDQDTSTVEQMQVRSESLIDYYA